MITRWQQQALQHALTVRRVVLLNGARQCGKTTLAKHLGVDDILYRTLDDQAYRQLAQDDPQSFIKHDAKTLIIDEVQRVPALLPAIKMAVDENIDYGRYLLTGSANIQSLPGVQESLAGRIRKVRLRPLTQGELLGTTPNFLANAFSQSFSNQALCGRKTLLELVFRGGFPEAISLPARDRRQWHVDYIQALLERDLQDIVRIQRHDAMQQLITILAAWSGKFMDVTAMSSGLAIQRPTVESYINALEALYLMERVRPWSNTDYGRVGKQYKFFMADSGLMSSLLHWNMEKIEFDPDRSGKAIETLVFNELATQVDVGDGIYQLFHYRDREKREIDFLIEHEDGALLGIEVKAGSAINKNDFKHLQWFRDNLAKDRLFIGVVLYTGELAGRMGENLWAVPLNSLWS